MVPVMNIFATSNHMSGLILMATVASILFHRARQRIPLPQIAQVILLFHRTLQRLPLLQIAQAIHPHQKMRTRRWMDL